MLFFNVFYYQTFLIQTIILIANLYSISLRLCLSSATKTLIGTIQVRPPPHLLSRRSET